MAINEGVAQTASRTETAMRALVEGGATGTVGKGLEVRPSETSAHATLRSSVGVPLMGTTMTLRATPPCPSHF